MSVILAINDEVRLPAKDAGRKAKSRLAASAETRAAARRSGADVGASLDAVMDATVMQTGPIARQAAQLPSFAPMLDELELAGWSSHRRMLSGNFHDWLMLDGRTILAVAGQAVSSGSTDTIEAALVAQAAWATIRAHAGRLRDAGELLSLTAGSLWQMPGDGVQMAVAVALLDTVDATASIAMAGDCLVWRVRAAAFEQLTIRQPLLGGVGEFSYASQFVNLAVRERLLLVADNSLERSATLALNVAANFSRLDAETHRRMVAADALAMVRNQYQQSASESVAPSASIVAVRRR